MTGAPLWMVDRLILGARLDLPDAMMHLRQKGMPY